MDAPNGQQRASVSEQLFAESHRFDFFQAVRLLEQLGRDEAHAAHGDAARPVGKDYAPKKEAIRFRTSPSLRFPSAAIQDLRSHQADPETGETEPPEMSVGFLGLTGPNGVLPDHYTSLLIARVRMGDYALRDFLDVFHHRIISLFYRAWEKYRFPFHYERARRPESKDEDVFTHCLYCLVGLGTRRLRRRLGVDDEAFLYYAGHFAHAPRSAVGLESVLADYFGLPVQVRQFQGQWLYLSPEDLFLFRTPAWPQGRNNSLGTTAVIGSRAWDVESKFRVRLGPLSYVQFRWLMPCGDMLRPLCQMVRSYVGPQFDFDVQPVLRREEVPLCRLGAKADDASHLGWNTWIHSKRFQHDVDDAVFAWEG